MTWAELAGPRPALRLLAGTLGVLLVLIVRLAQMAFKYRAANDRTKAEWDRRESAWEPAMLAVLGGELPDAGIHQLVGAADRLYFVDYLLRFARRLDGAERLTIERIAAPYLADVARRFHQRDAEFRARAVQTLSSLGLRTYGGLVVAALDDRSSLVAMVAARALAQPGNPEYAAAVLGHLGRFQEWRPSFLASMLAQMGPEIAPVLRNTFADPAVEPGIRAVAAEALLELHDPEAADVAVAVIGGRVDRDLLAASLAVLMDVGQRRHLAAVRPLIASTEPVVRARAYATIARIGETSDLEVLREALRDDSPWVTIRVIDALRAAGAVGVLEQLGDSAKVRTELALAGPVAEAR